MLLHCMISLHEATLLVLIITTLPLSSEYLQNCPKDRVHFAFFLQYIVYHLIPLDSELQTQPTFAKAESIVSTHRYSFFTRLLLH